MRQFLSTEKCMRARDLQFDSSVQDVQGEGLCADVPRGRHIIMFINGTVVPLML